ncbi:MAG: type IV secretory system conjugative DNA transfer family protein [Pseudomonadota bacterium]
MVLRQRAGETPNILNDIPRGNRSKFLKDQIIPQAGFQKQEIIETHPSLDYDPKNPNGKILIGSLGSRLIGLQDDRHIKTTAGNRSGKSVTVQSNLFFYDGSCFVVDPKGEHYNKTGLARVKRGQRAIGLDPFDRARGDVRQYRGRYNPIMRLKINDPAVIEKAMLISDGIVMETGQEKDPHWNEASKAVILGLILYTRFGSNIEEENRHLGTVRDLIAIARRQAVDENGEKSYVLLNRMKAGIGHLKAKQLRLYNNIKNNILSLYEASREEMPGILSTMKRHTVFLEFESMRDVMSGHDFELEDLKSTKNGLSVYLILPAGRMGSCNRWLRIMLNLLIDAMEVEETEPHAPVLAILDEFPVLGHMSQLQDAVGQMAGFGLKLWFVLQDEGQGKSLYGDRWESFAANCGVTQWFANVDLTTTEYLSKSLGQTPVMSVRMQDSTYDQHERGGQGRSIDTQMYPLMMPDEISRYFARDDRYKRQLIRIAGKHPMIIQRVEWWNKDAPYSQYF